MRSIWTKDGRFTRICDYYGYWNGFVKFATPILFLNRTHLYDQYKNSLLIVSALNDMVCPSVRRMYRDQPEACDPFGP